MRGSHAFASFVRIFCVCLIGAFVSLAAVSGVQAREISSDMTLDSLKEQIIITGDCTVTLDSVTYTNPDGVAVVVRPRVKATLILSGDNVLKSTKGGAGIKVTEGATLTIDGTGTLEVYGGNSDGAAIGAGGGAGIGGGGNNGDNEAGESAGTVIVLGGSITAYGGSPANNGAGGAGIGGGGGGSGSSNGGDGGTVIIHGGSITANGGPTTGNGGGGAGIGGGGSNSGTGGAGAEVTIDGGIVKAAGGTGNDGHKALDIGAGRNRDGNSGTSGATEITGGSIEATSVDKATNGSENGSMTVVKKEMDYGVTNAGKRLSFNVGVAQPYQYTFTVPKDGKAYLWLPGNAVPPVPDDVSKLTVPTLTLTPEYANDSCVIGLSLSDMTGWERRAPGTVIWKVGDAKLTSDDITADGLSAPGIYSYRAKAGTDAISIWSAPTFVTLNAPDISGPSGQMLQLGYRAASSPVFTVTGLPEPAVTVSGDKRITWNDTEKRLEIEERLSVGVYPVTLTAVNGIADAASCDFTLTVKKAGGSGGSGCNAGFGVSLLFCGAALIFAVRRKR